MRAALRIGLFVLTAAIMVASFVNVFGDDAENAATANAIACPTKCNAEVAIQRTPLGETFHFTKANSEITVRCTRAAILVGPWSCAKD